ncbi:hypothetical protein VTO42DRAFT_5315 [Malbranchea cinnamomea]
MAEKVADVVIAGGGTTGLIVAGRLARAKPDLSILVLEGGKGTRNEPRIVNPAFYLHNIAPGSTTATFYKSRASEHLGGRELVIPTGGALGGGSSINFMVYARAQLIDFDDWNTEGWSGKDMLPFLKKPERFRDTSDGIDKSVHGYEGEFTISSGTNAQAAFQEDFLNACAEIGINQTPDVMDLKTANAVGRWNMFIDKETGLRQDVPHRLIYPILDAGDTGLEVLTESKVVRILFDESKRAVGVEYLPSNADPSSKPLTARANKLVVVASGAFGTPQILERSGVGDKERLSKLGIPVISHLPEVGNNYQDHNVIFYPYHSTAAPDETIDGVVSGRLTIEEALQKKAENPTRYVLGWNGLDCVGKIRPNENDLKKLPPILKERWERDFRDRETRPFMLMSSLAAYVGDHSKIAAGQHFSLGPYTPYPYSRGYVHITGRSIADTPDFDCGFFSDPADLAKLVWGYKKQREIARRMSHYRGALKVGHPTFPQGSKADYDYVDAESKAQGRLIPIEYSEEDDKAIETFIRANVSTTWHSMGTCAMKPQEQGGVVDKNLNVYGVKNLKIVDLSICPANVAANTYSTALAVGEKAASIIAKDLGIPYPL